MTHIPVHLFTVDMFVVTSLVSGKLCFALWPKQLVIKQIMNDTIPHRTKQLGFVRCKCMEVELKSSKVSLLNILLINGP